LLTVNDLMSEETLHGHARALAEASEQNTRWRREACINLIPSEHPVSDYVAALCMADPAARYNEHRRQTPEGPEQRYYKGTSFIMEKEEELKAALCAFFGCARAEVRVISGQMANDTVFDALVQFRNRGAKGEELARLRPALVHDLVKGGHLSAQPMGALKNYIATDPDTGKPAALHFPARADNLYRIDVEATKALIRETPPQLLVFGRSVIIHREPVAEITAFIHEQFGEDNPDRPLIMYDGAHVLGLLGPAFQDPFAEGADIVTGSTHKTFFGPQRGVILGNIRPGSAFEGLWRHIVSRTFPGHVSNHHLGTMLGLLGATYEMLSFKDTYPAEVVRNAKAFAAALHGQGLAIEGDPVDGFTETHQVLLNVGPGKGDWAASLFEANNIITNHQALFTDPNFAEASGVRLGVQEMTRYGMKEDDFQALANLMAEILREGVDRPAGHWQDAVKKLRSRFTKMQYCLT
jgi:glycine/serine hydroxymethyltransferase